MTPQAIFFYLGIAAFAAFIALGVWAVAYYVRNDIRGVIDDLSGKAKRQDIEERRKGFESVVSRSARSLHYLKNEAKRVNAHSSFDQSKTASAKRAASERGLEASSRSAKKGKKTSRELFADAAFTNDGEFSFASRQEKNSNFAKTVDKSRVREQIFPDEGLSFDFEIIQSNVVVHCDKDLLRG